MLLRFGLFPLPLKTKAPTVLRSNFSYLLVSLTLLSPSPISDSIP